MSYTIWCILIGEDSQFPVKLDETKTVYDLKEEIKTKNNPRLNNFAATELTLYKIDVDATEDGIKEARRLSLNLNELEKLNPSAELQGVFRNTAPPGGKIHILVQVPEGESIGSAVYGDVAKTFCKYRRVISLTGNKRSRHKS